MKLCLLNKSIGAASLSLLAGNHMSRLLDAISLLYCIVDVLHVL